MVKRCSRCEESKSLSEFHKNIDSPDGFRSTCKPCHRDTLKAYREANPDKVKMMQKTFRDKEDPNSRRLRERRWRQSPAGKRSARRKYERNRDRYRGYYHERRARILRNGWESFDLAEVLIRDRGICQLCDRPVESDSDPLEYDHIIPLSKGGRHSRSNVQVSHRSCNREKHDNLRAIDLLKGFYRTFPEGPRGVKLTDSKTDQALLHYANQAIA